MSWFDNSTKKIAGVIAFLALFGLTPTVIVKYVKKTNHLIKNIIVNNAVFSAAFRGMLELDYVGIVKIDGEELEVEIRSGYVYDEYKNESVIIEWIFVDHGDHSSMYEAVYSPIQRTYHFTDLYGDIYYVKNLIKMEL